MTEPIMGDPIGSQLPLAGSDRNRILDRVRAKGRQRSGQRRCRAMVQHRPGAAP
jgi:hypothetical protein